MTAIPADCISCMVYKSEIDKLQLLFSCWCSRLVQSLEVAHATTRKRQHQLVQQQQQQQQQQHQQKQNPRSYVHHRNHSNAIDPATGVVGNDLKHRFPQNVQERFQGVAFRKLNPPQLPYGLSVSEEGEVCVSTGNNENDAPPNAAVDAVVASLLGSGRGAESNDVGVEYDENQANPLPEESKEEIEYGRHQSCGFEEPVTSENYGGGEGGNVETNSQYPGGELDETNTSNANNRIIKREIVDESDGDCVGDSSGWKRSRVEEYDDPPQPVASTSAAALIYNPNGYNLNGINEGLLSEPASNAVREFANSPCFVQSDCNPEIVAHRIVGEPLSDFETVPDSGCATAVINCTGELPVSISGRENINSLIVDGNIDAGGGDVDMHLATDGEHHSNVDRVADDAKQQSISELSSMINGIATTANETQEVTGSNLVDSKDFHGMLVGGEFGGERLLEHPTSTVDTSEMPMCSLERLLGTQAPLEPISPEARLHESVSFSTETTSSTSVNFPINTENQSSVEQMIHQDASFVAPSTSGVKLECLPYLQDQDGDGSQDCQYKQEFSDATMPPPPSEFDYQLNQPGVSEDDYSMAMLASYRCSDKPITPGKSTIGTRSVKRLDHPLAATFGSPLDIDALLAMASGESPGGGAAGGGSSQQPPINVNDYMIDQGPVFDADRYACSVCGKGFKRPGDTRRHIRSHFGLNSCQCPLCGVKFERRDNMKKHVTTCHIDLI